MKQKLEWYRDKIMHVPKYRDSLKWQLRVSKMKPAQVMAIYNKFKADGYFKEKKSQGENLKDGFYYQMTIFDYCGAAWDKEEICQIK